MKGAELRKNNNITSARIFSKSESTSGVPDSSGVRGNQHFLSSWLLKGGYLREMESPRWVKKVLGHKGGETMGICQNGGHLVGFGRVKPGGGERPFNHLNMLQNYLHKKYRVPCNHYLDTS